MSGFSKSWGGRNRQEKGRPGWCVFVQASVPQTVRIMGAAPGSATFVGGPEEVGMHGMTAQPEPWALATVESMCHPHSWLPELPVTTD